MEVEDASAAQGLAAGFALAAASAIFNGSFGVFGKLCKKPPDPVIFNTFLTYGALLSSLLVAALQPLWEDGFHIGFTWWGALAGSLFVFATLFTFIAIPLAGLATSSATWSCSAVLVAFLWGAIGPTSPPRKPMKDPLLAVLGVIIIVGGVLVINFSSQIGRALGRAVGPENPVEDVPSDDEEETSNVSRDEIGSSSDGEGGALGGKALGILSAATVGLFGGSILVPAAYIPKRNSGLHLLPSFGLGAAVVGTLIGAVYWATFRPELSKEIRGEVVRNGMFAGVVWNMGNVCQIIAQDRFHLSYGIAYPMLQCALLFAGLWGIYYFREVTHGPTILAFWSGALVLISGVALLGLFGPGA